jgi:peptidoglycan/xylan/chitin deacetylase (PgdA/CDA1 family)
MSEPSSRLSVLMYHALFDASGACEGADPHYAVSPGAFARHLALFADAGLRASSMASILASGSARGKIALTFDDGHESNAAAAAQILRASGSADLFINPTTVGKPHYLDWRALAELANAGISIQSHGQTHRYFDELPDHEIEQELATSKKEIEDHLGRTVTLFAPPGGRLTRRVADIAKRVGYQAICSSSVGLWADGDSPWRIPRFAVLDSTGDEQLRRWVRQDRWELSRLQVRHGVLSAAKGLLGNRGYERLRARLLRRRGQAGLA